MIFEQLALALKNKFDLKIFTVLKYFLSFRIFEQLMFALKFFTVLNILFAFRIFEQLALALKTRFDLKFFTVLKYFLSFSAPMGLWYRAVVVNLGEFPTGGEWRSCQVGNDRPDSRNTASKFNTPHPNVDLLYKSQPFTDCFINKNNQYMEVL